MDTLVLNRSYAPVTTVGWQEAVTLWYLDKAEILEEYEDRQLRSWKLAMNMPAVIRLYHFVKPPRHRSRHQPFTRKNVWLRDQGTCQYCGRRITLREMTFDHVYPRCSGARTCWTNIVCACQECNRAKANRTPSEAGFSLIRLPVAPRKAAPLEAELWLRLRNLKHLPHQSWQNFIYWNIPLEEG